MSQNAKIRYVDRFGREELREQAAILIERANLDERGSARGRVGYFGKFMPIEGTPEILLEFSRGSAFEVSRNGIVYRTHGLGSWRGGYMITPPGVEFEIEDWHRSKIIDGFYFVRTR